MEDDFLAQWTDEYMAVQSEYIAKFGRKPRNQSYWQTPDIVMADMKAALISGEEVVYPRPPKGAVL